MAGSCPLAVRRHCSPSKSVRLSMCLMLALCLVHVRAVIFSTTIKWERIGATPHFLSAASSCTEFNYDPSGGCTEYEHRQVLFTVDLVLDVSAFATPPTPGTKAATFPSLQFCRGDGTGCFDVVLSIIAVDSVSSWGGEADSAFTTVRAQYQEVVNYQNSQGPNATAAMISSGTLMWYEQCIGSEVAGEVCLGPIQGPVEIQCLECLDDIRSTNLHLETTVFFADGCPRCTPGYDATVFNTHQVYPVTNHHSPATTILPIVTIPLLSSKDITIQVSIPATDEDGTGRPISCRSASSGCTNVDMGWNMLGASSDGASLTLHSDALGITEQPGTWSIERRDENDGGGITVTIEGPIQKPYAGPAPSTLGTPYYPARLIFTDPFRAQVVLDFMVRICQGPVEASTSTRERDIKPYLLSSQGITLYSGEVGLLPPIFITKDTNRHDAPATKVDCFVGEPCEVDVTDAMYETRGGFPLQSRGSCRWGVSELSQAGLNSTKCVDFVQTSESSFPPAIEIDGAHAVVQGCPVGLTVDTFSPACHNLTVLPSTEAGTATARLTVFGARAAATGPKELDIGKKLMLCFQAKSCPECCHSPPHCVTVHLLGRPPNITVPSVPPSCPVPSFTSDVVLTTALPSLEAFAVGCPAIYVCWTLLQKYAMFGSPLGLPPEFGLASQYGQEAAPNQLRFKAVDDDAGETVDMEILFDPDISTVATLDPVLTSVSPYPVREAGLTSGGDVNRHVELEHSKCKHQLRYWGSFSQDVADLYKLNEGCRVATRDLNITLAYGDGVAGVSPVFTANVPYINGLFPPWGGDGEQGVYHVRFTEDRTVCFTATDNQAVKWGRGMNNTRAQCHVLRFRGPPVFVRSETRENDSPFLSVDQHLMGNGTKTINLYVGEPVELTIRARDPNPEDSISIRVVGDPGLPVGVDLSATQCVEHGTQSDNGALADLEVNSACAEALRTLRWTPQAGEDGRTHRVCFVARDEAGFCASDYSHMLSSPGPRATADGFYGLPLCIDLAVQRSDAYWTPSTDPTPEGATRVVHVGCEITFVLNASDSKYVLELFMEADTPLEPGMELVAVQQGPNAVSELRWIPQQGSEGSTRTLCFSGRALSMGGPSEGGPRLLSGAPTLPRVCLDVSVRRCKYCVAPGETLLMKMKEFAPDMNWLRLWAANGNDDGDERTETMDDPDFLASEGHFHIINIGPIYKAVPGDTLISIAARFRTTVKSLLQLNPDVATAEALSAGQDLCLIPCTAWS